MSIIRISALKDVAYAPKRDGTLDKRNYSRGVGKFGRFPSPGPTQLRPHLQRLIEDLVPASGEPLVIMVHGFLFDPEKIVSPEPKENDNPHGRLYHFEMRDMSEEIREHTSSWPLGLGYDTPDDGSNGLAVAFGWQSSPGFAMSIIHGGQNFYARAYDNAEQSANVLIALIESLADIITDRPIDIFCHSLGSRVIVRALAAMAKDANGWPSLSQLGRVVILGGSEYVVEAKIMHDRLQAAQLSDGPVFYNIVSRENDVLDVLAENFGPRTFGNTQVIGHNGLETSRKEPNWIDLQIDSPTLQDWMADHGFEISGDRPRNIWDHWYYYTYRPNMELFKSILRDRSQWGIAELRANGIPDGVSKRFSISGD